MSGQDKRKPLGDVLSPLIFGCGTFNVQYNKDPYAMDTLGLVKQALTLGIRAFDTSPYHGPSELILSKALHDPSIRDTWPRNSYCVLTKVGRVSSDEFNYSPEWVRKSIKRSLERLATDYLDVVYCHDVEFVSVDQALGAIKELRSIRDENGSIKYVGISGYPLEVLCHIAERVLRETGEPIDAVQSYGHCTIQNTTLASMGAERLRAAGVSVVTNASPLNMGLLRRTGPYTAGGDWHPSPLELRDAVKRASDFCDEHDAAIEDVAIRYSLEHWLRAGTSVGAYVDPAVKLSRQNGETTDEHRGDKLGVSVIGVSNAAELSLAMDLWHNVLNYAAADSVGNGVDADELSSNRRKTQDDLVDGIKKTLGEYYDYSWASPPPDFVNAKDRPAGEAGSRKGPKLGESGGIST